MIRSVIIDDEAKAIQNLQWELERHCTQVEIIASFTQSKKALKFLAQPENQVDLVFLDIHMPELSGLRWMERVEQRDFEVIIVSAHDDYVFDSMKHEVFDFLVKPIFSDALKDSIRRLGQKIARSSLINRLEVRLNEVLQGQTEKKKVQFSLGHQELFVDLNDLIYFKAEGNYCELKHKNGEVFLINHQLGAAVKMLDDRFFRVHNSYVVNLDRVLIYDKKSAELQMDDGTKVPISRRRKDGLLGQL